MLAIKPVLHAPVAVSPASCLLLANGLDGHHGWGDGWWIAMAIGMALVWAAVVAGIVWLVRELASNRRTDRVSSHAALEILARRLAEGAITVEEYERRRDVLAKTRDQEKDSARVGPRD